MTNVHIKPMLSIAAQCFTNPKGKTQCTKTILFALFFALFAPLTARAQQKALADECTVTTFPWSEDFDSYNEGNFIAPCWVNEHIEGNDTRVFRLSSSVFTHDGSINIIQWSSPSGFNAARLVLPEMNLPSSDYRFVFSIFRLSGANTGAGVRVFASTDGEIDGATELAFVPTSSNVGNDIIPSQNNQNAWFTYQLPIGMSGTCRIILRAECPGEGAIFMDDFIVEHIPACSEIPTLTSAETTGSHGFTASFAPHDDTQSEWIYAVTTTDQQPSSGNTVLQGTTTETTFSVTDDAILASTSYYLWVGVDCPIDQTLYWCETSSNFVTFEECYDKKVTYIEHNNLTYNSVSLNWTTASATDQWKVQLTSSDFDNLIYDEIVSDNPSITLGAEYIAPETTYHVRVAPYCEVTEDYTPWTHLNFTTPESCPAPWLSDVSDISAYSATLTWNGSSDSYNLVVGSDTYPDVTSPYTLNNLTPETSYTAQVIGHCTATDEDSESNTLNFTTAEACPIPVLSKATNITSVSADLVWNGSIDVINDGGYMVQYREMCNMFYQEDFENGIGDWTLVDCASQTGIKIGGYAVGDFFAFFRHSKPQYLITPDLTGIADGMVVEFSYKNMLSDSHETFQVGFSSTNNAVSSFTFGETITAHDTQWHTYSAAIPTGTKYICLKHTSQNNGWYLYIDDFIVHDGTEAGPWVTATQDWNALDYTCPIEGLSSYKRYEARVKSNCGVTEEWSNTLSFVTLPASTKVFATEGNWNTESNWIPSGLPTISDDIILRANATVPAGYVAEAHSIDREGGLTFYGITIEDGGQLKTDIVEENVTVVATMKKNIVGYTQDGGWSLIASPKGMESPAAFGMITAWSNYDLYSFDFAASDGLEWRNYKRASYYMYNGVGYLYANASDITLSFSDEVRANNVPETKDISYSEGGTFSFNGWNLHGNPFSCDVYLYEGDGTSQTPMPYYRMNDAGNGLIPGSGAVHPLEGYFVQATATGQTYTVSRNAPQTQGNMLSINLVEAVGSAEMPTGDKCGLSKAIGATVADRAIIRFGEGNVLEKFSLGNHTSKVFIPQQGEDYAVVTAESNAGEIPLNFKPAKDGIYTLSIDLDNVGLGYLHLIDNLTGADVDLLATNDYTFTAKKIDYASRFKLVFKADDALAGSASDAPFAYISNGNIIITTDTSDASLQVMDVLGRVVASHGGHTQCVPTLGMPQGVYVLRLISGNEVKTQKIVIQ